MFTQTVTNTAATQITAYLNQCKDFAESAANSTDSALQKRLETICCTADNVCEEIGRDVKYFHRQQKETAELYRVLEGEITAFNYEVTTLCAQHTKEEKEAKAECVAMKNAAIEGVRKALSVRHADREPGKKVDKHKILKALREL